MGLLPSYGYKDLIEWAKRSGNVEAHEQLLDLREELVRAREEIAQLKNEQALSKNLKFEAPYYWNVLGELRTVLSAKSAKTEIQN